jgi:two-component sensor histidine kinase
MSQVAESAASRPSAAGDTLAEIQERIARAREQVARLEKEVVVLGGRLSNRTPEAGKEALESNQELKSRLQRLARAHAMLMLGGLYPRSPGEQQVDLESLRKQLLDFCKSKKVDPELWKKIES